MVRPFVGCGRACEGHRSNGPTGAGTSRAALRSVALLRARSIVAILVAGGLVAGCAPERRFTVQDAVPEAAAAPRTELLPLADGRSFDLAAARSNLERYLELPTGEDALDRTDPTLDVLPAPPGTAWFRLRDGVDLESAAATRLGRLVLSRVDSAESVTTDDIRSITRADDTGANGIAVRLALRPERRGAFERMCAEAGGGVLLFVSRREVELAVRVGEGLPSRSGDVLVSGLSAAQAEVLIRGNDRRGP